MQYLLLIYRDEKRWAELSREEHNRVHVACGAWHDELSKAGLNTHCQALQPASTATTVREKFGKITVTDGPFAETREVLGGFETIECQDLNEALTIAKRFPGLGAGISVEVRPVMTDCME